MPMPPLPLKRPPAALLSFSILVSSSLRLGHQSWLRVVSSTSPLAPPFEPSRLVRPWSKGEPPFCVSTSPWGLFAINAGHVQTRRAPTVSTRATSYARASHAPGKTRGDPCHGMQQIRAWRKPAEEPHAASALSSAPRLARRGWDAEGRARGKTLGLLGCSAELVSG